MIETVEVNASFVQLSNDKIAIIDTEDMKFVNQWKWYAHKPYNSFYVRRKVELKKVNGKRRQKCIYLHRELMNPPEKRVVDHINGNGLDNRKCNLRIVTHRQNLQNQKNRIIKTSKYPGVHWQKKTGKWVSQFYINGKSITKSFDTEVDAILFYQKTIRERLGEEINCIIEEGAK